MQVKLYKNLFFLFLLILLTGVLNVKDIDRGEFWWTDEARHAMDGVFILDFIHDLPLHHPYNYAERYYARYPALGFTWYPPFFAIVEAIFFKILGISVFSARLTVVLFSILAVCFWYLFVKRIYDVKLAFFSSLLFVSNLQVVFWSRSVMLELPSMALIIITCFFFYNYFVLNKKPHLYFLTISLIIALYTKQTSIFLLPLFFSFIFIQKLYKKLFKKPVIICMIVFIISILPLVLFTIIFGKVGINASFGNLHQLRGESLRSSLIHWSAYFKLLPKIFIKPVLILSLISFLIYYVTNYLTESKRDIMFSFFILWVFWWYIAFSILGEAVARYGIYVVPAISLIAVWFINSIRHKKILHGVTISLISFICFYQVKTAYSTPRLYTKGYEEAAKHVINNTQGHTILFSGVHNGNFIFFVRKYDFEKRAVVLRASKILFSMSVYKEWGYVSHVKSREDIYNLLNKYGTKYIVIEDQDLIGTTPNHWLRQILKTNKFKLVKKIKIKSNLDKYKDISILIYEYIENPKEEAEKLVIEFPLLEKKISIPFNSLLNEK